jgi:CrcB protein
MDVSLPRTLLVALGGVAGCVARYWVSAWVQGGGTAFPAGTLAVNVAGSFAIGVVMALSNERGVVGADLRLLLTTGFCGGFTTMSTFSYETLALAHNGHPAVAAGNIGATLVACLAAAWAGGMVARAW